MTSLNSQPDHSSFISIIYNRSSGRLGQAWRCSAVTLLLPDCPDGETRCWELGDGNDWVGMFNMFPAFPKQLQFQRSPIKTTEGHQGGMGGQFRTHIRLPELSEHIPSWFKHISV